MNCPYVQNVFDASENRYIFLVVGVFFRFANLDAKVYWHDETYTSLRISGYTVNETIKLCFF